MGFCPQNVFIGSGRNIVENWFPSQNDIPKDLPNSARAFLGCLIFLVHLLLIGVCGFYIFAVIRSWLI